MSGNIGGQDGNQIKVKLFNGQTINLKKLDQLVGKSTEGSVFADYDSVNSGGNGNTVFDAGEIAQIKLKLRQYQANDSTVSQEELNQMFGYGQLDAEGKKKNFDVNNLASLLDSIDEAETQSYQAVKGDTPPRTNQNENEIFTKYTVQPGDTPAVIAKKLGFTGEDAKAYANKLKEHFKNSNYLTRQGWLRIGQEITLLGEHSEAIKNMSDYSEDNAVLQQRYAQSEHGKKAIAAEMARKGAEEVARHAELEVEKKPEPPKDTTPPAQRGNIATFRNKAKTDAKALSDQIKPNSLNSRTRDMLAEKVKNTNVAYILENYSDIVTDIDDEWGMDIEDVKKNIIDPLNSRLRELGMNKHCLPKDLSNLSMDEIQKKCNEVAALIRQTDAENGYVFIPKHGNEGKVHKPRLASQSDNFIGPKPKVTTSTTPTTNEPVKEETTHDDKTYYLKFTDYSYPEALQDRLVELRKYGYEIEVVKIKDGYRLDFVDFKSNMVDFLTPFAQTENPIPETIKDDASPTSYFDLAFGKKSLILDKDGNLLQQNETYYDRKVVTQYGENDQPTVTNTQYNEQVNYSELDAQRTTNSKVAVDIDINRPDHLNKDGKRFADSLEKHKAALMKELGLTNEQYNNLANLAMGIAEQETHFGASTYTTMSGDEQFQWRNLKKDIADSLGLIDAAYDLGIKSGSKSIGMTQFKLGGFDHIKHQFKAFGINSNEDLENNPENQAIATIIGLNNKRLVAESEKWQNYLTTNNANITKEDDKITTNDLIALLYNGNSRVTNRIKNSNDTVRISDTGESGASYARNVRAYTKHYYTVTEDATSRRRAETLSVESQGNNGKIGTVIFMPSAYTTDVKNTKEDVLTLETALNNNTSIPQDLKEKLINAVRKNEIAFGYGLKPEEAQSITANDAKLLLDKLDGLKGRISNLVDPSKIRKEAKATQDDFRASYLQSRQVVVNDSDVSRGSILTALSSGDVRNERIQERGVRKIIVNEDNVKYFREGMNGRSHETVDRGQYYGFGVEADKGVNPYDANGNYIPYSQRVLAECGSDVAAMMDCGGNCTTGVKASLESAGTVKDRKDIGYADEDGKWHKCTNAKELAIYFSKHPEKFEEVKYVSLGNGTSREINATDIKNLPAGLLVVFIPGEGYENQAGHAFITNGNGQGYADEVDNLRWDDFKSQGAGNGKGEHGTFKIYRVKV